MQFRKDINGLRAIAVIAVILFHFNAAWMPGGFVGVDVFFVISGFLMTGIIFRGIEQDNFSILKFYVARANRIIPALAVLCLILLVFGWFYLIPFDYRVLGKHVGSSMAFLSNIVYWGEAGYFDASSHEKWLIHTWSLSVEWQFYIIYPLALVIIRRFVAIKIMKLIIVWGTIIGFIFSAIATYKWPNASYYILPTRAWEMMLGGVAQIYPLSVEGKKKKYFEWLGLTFIICSCFLISKESLWPGYLALFPVLGTFFIIQAKRNNSYFTGNVIFQKIGDWSYSIYLWHWPLVVAIYYFSLNDAYVYLGIGLSIFLGFLSYKYVETIKFRNVYSSFFQYFKCIPIHLVLFVGLLGSYVFIVQGKNYIEYLYPENVPIVHLLEKKIVMPKRTNGYCFYSHDMSDFEANIDIGTTCILGDKSKKSDTLLFGDSYAANYEPFLDKLFNKNYISFISVTTNWCSPSLTSNYTGPKDDISYEQCLLNRKYLNNAIRSKKYKNIIFAGSWGSVNNKGYLRDVENVIHEAQRNGINVFVMPTPLAYKQNPLPKFYRQLYRGEETNIASYISDYEQNNEVNDILFNITQKYKKVQFIKRSCIFNDNGLFNYMGFKVPYSLDGRHLSVLGSLFAENTFEESSCYSSFIKKLTLQ